jgi:hypothetical protein
MDEKKDLTSIDETDDTEIKRRKRSNSYAQWIKRANNMIAGINEHQQTLTNNGVNDLSAQAINTQIEDCKTIENQQEIFKGKLHEQTQQLDIKVGVLKDTLSKYTLIIKATIPQKRWVDFGISAKR